MSSARSPARGSADQARTLPDRWVIAGPDLDEDDLTLVVVIESGVIVVTVW
jgi:hypothetical protein